MRNDISSKLIAYAKEDSYIESMFYIKNENTDSFNKVYIVVNEVIIGKLEEDLANLFEDVILINRTKDEFTIEKNKTSYTSIHMYMADNIKLTASIVASENADDFIKNLPADIEFMYNKPGFERLTANADFKYDKPKEYELISTVKNFFGTAYEVSLYVDEKNELAACLKMDQLRSYLKTILNFYVKDKYSYTLDMGADGSRLKNTLEAELKDQFLLTYHHEDLMDIYSSLFKACMLFRKVAMDLCEKYDFEYPRQIDVETMKVLRTNYKALESFLN